MSIDSMISTLSGIFDACYGSQELISDDASAHQSGGGIVVGFTAEKRRSNLDCELLKRCITKLGRA
jgi:hypothetical protein